MDAVNSDLEDMKMMKTTEKNFCDLTFLAVSKFQRYSLVNNNYILHTCGLEWDKCASLCKCGGLGTLRYSSKRKNK